jgi:hypothetical protein
MPEGTSSNKFASEVEAQVAERDQVISGSRLPVFNGGNPFEEQGKSRVDNRAEDDPMMNGVFPFAT